MKKYKIKQVRSGIGRIGKQKKTLQALGINKMHQTKEVTGTPQVLGMINKVKHLLVIEEI